MLEIGKSRSRKSRSSVWMAFTKSTDGESASCNSCKKTFKISSGSTSALHNHLTSKHPFKNQPSTLDTMLRSEAQFVSALRQRQIDEAVLMMMVQDLLPFRLVERSGFLNFCSVLCPNYLPPSRKTLATQFNVAFLSKLEQIKSLTRQAVSPSYACDLWKSKANDYYCSVTVHFIDQNWQLQSVLCATRHITGPHTGEGTSFQSNYLSHLL